MSRSKKLRAYPKSHYSKLTPEEVDRYAIQISEEISTDFLLRMSNYDHLVDYAVLALREQTVRNYRDSIEYNYRITTFSHYLHNFSLAENSLLHEAIVGELKVRKLASIL